MDSLGIIAGNGDFPLIFARSARQCGVGHIVAAAFEGETDPGVQKVVDEIEWIRIGQLTKLIRVFTTRQITRVVMAGGITPSNLFDNLRLDLRMMNMAARLKERNAKTIFGAIASELSQDGVELIDPRPFLGDGIPSPGLLTRRQPNRQQQEDVGYGWKIAKSVSELDIGQTAVVKKGSVLAVEGFEGTDECIRRGGLLAGEDGGAVVVKVSKPDHDYRFDIPCVGLRTIASCHAGKIAVLALEAGSSLLLGRNNIVRDAEKIGLCLVAVSKP